MTIQSHFGILSETLEEGTLLGQLGEAIRFYGDKEFCSKCGLQVFVDGLGYICQGCGRVANADSGKSQFYKVLI
jgi:hypothetical protein